jgi:spore germination protein GerM
VAARKGTKTKKAAKTPSSSAKKAQGKKSTGKTAKAPIPWAVLFWLIFAIFIFGLFIFNHEAINSGIQIVKNAFSSREATYENAPEVKEEEPPVAPTAAQQPARQQPATQPSAAQPAEPVKPPDSQQAAQQNTQSQTGQNQQPAQRPAETRERVLYFIEVDRSGYISRVQANRRLPLSDSPLTDVIQALIAGPNAEEKGKGLISLIPQAAKLLSASIRGNTAYLSFNEEFQYNIYGVEGYAGQLRQIVFTVTEFPNIADVQILIEGRRIDYLGEGVWVGSPVSRDML